MLYIFFSCYAVHPDLHSFPTRRSSDLPSYFAWGCFRVFVSRPRRSGLSAAVTLHQAARYQRPAVDQHEEDQLERRSEEHTSELQSQFHLVCRLLLEKKNASTSESVFAG